jgi:glycerol-3-phosphate cytidylyltransferase
MKKVITYGTYDLLHVGHTNLLKRAKALGDYLIVAVSTDSFNKLKHKEAFLPYEQRKAILETIKYVDEVIPEENWGQKVNDIKKHDIDIFVMGDDWKGKFDFLKDICEVVYLPRTEEISTTELKQNIVSKINGIKHKQTKKYSYTSVQKSVNRVDSWWSRLVLRHPCSWVLYLISNYTSWTPNFLSTVGFFFVLASGMTILTGDFLLAAIFFQFSLVFDFIDGRLARLTKQGSFFGEFLDNFFDQLKVVILLLALYVSYLTYFPIQVDSWFVMSMIIYMFVQEFSVILWLFVEKNVDNKKNTHQIFEQSVNGSVIGSFIIYITKLFDRIGLRAAPSNIETNVLVFSLLPLLPYLNHEIFIIANILLLSFVLPELYVVIKIVKSRDIINN